MTDHNQEQVSLPADRRTGRRAFLRGASLASAALLSRLTLPAHGWAQTAQSAPSSTPSGSPSPASNPDYRIEIAEIEWELSPKKKIRTPVYGGQMPGKVLRLTEGKPVTIEIVNRLDHPEIVHWHGQWIPPEVDGSMEEGTPMIAP